MDDVQNITELQIISITRDFLRELQAERALLAITLDASPAKD